MSTIFRKERVCPVCGNCAEYTVLSSTSSFGPPDMDFRPAPLARDSMNFWIHECADCGFTFGSLGAVRVEPEFLETEEYTGCSGLDFRSDLAKMFYRSSLIYLENQKYYEAGSELQRAAWACDDCNDEENAVICRQKALSAFEHVPDDEDDISRFTVIKADLLRRCSRFDELFDKYSKLGLVSEDLSEPEGFDEPGDPNRFRRMIFYEVFLAHIKDAKCRDLSGCDSFNNWYKTPIDYEKLSQGEEKLQSNRGIRLFKQFLNSFAYDDLTLLSDLFDDDVLFFSASYNSKASGKDTVRSLLYDISVNSNSFDAMDAVITGINYLGERNTDYDAGTECLAIKEADADGYFPYLAFVLMNDQGKIARVDLVCSEEYEYYLYLPPR